ncbi:COG3650 family protein [Pukyongiella litopenaei]|nr:SH3 domain-containing protein [Pukyongiella litopenaei]
MALILVLAAPAASAQSYPALHDITGVSSFLNIRQGPGTGFAKVGRFLPGDTGIEVTGVNEAGTWGRVNHQEQAAWVFLAYLARQPDDPDRPLTASFRCFGTEPFWALALTQGDTAVLTTPSGPDQTFPVGMLAAASNRTEPWLLDMGAGAVAVIHRAECSDGMSDRAYGLAIDLLTGAAPRTLMDGCCSLAVN